MTEFDRLMHRLGMNRRDLAERLGLRRETVIRWRETVPTYVLEYLRKCVELQELENSSREAMSFQASVVKLLGERE